MFSGFRENIAYLNVYYETLRFRENKQIQEDSAIDLICKSSYYIMSINAYTVYGL